MEVCHGPKTGSKGHSPSEVLQYPFDQVSLVHPFLVRDMGELTNKFKHKAHNIIYTIL